MISLAQLASNHNTDKLSNNQYIRNFERHFSPLRDKPIRLLEIGVLDGGSLLLWRDYFPNALIVGLDLKESPFNTLPDRIQIFQGSQGDTKLLSTMAGKCAPEGFDIIIDDASHYGVLSRSSFQSLFANHLKSGGIYVVEDWGTGYWPEWPDGSSYLDSLPKAEHKIERTPTFLSRAQAKLQKTLRLGFKNSIYKNDHFRSTDPSFSSHNSGMVGFIKELVDEVAWPDITHPQYGDQSLQNRPSLISQLTLYTGHAFIEKA
jgi:hypothetical protein